MLNSTGAQSFTKELKEADCSLVLHWLGELITESLGLANRLDKDCSGNILGNGLDTS